MVREHGILDIRAGGSHAQVRGVSAVEGGLGVVPDHGGQLCRVFSRRLSIRASAVVMRRACGQAEC